MKKTTTFIVFNFLISAFCYSQGQGLEGVIVEKYYISDANDATDNDGGNLPEGSTTYRIYMDLAPGYKLESVFGSSTNELRIETTTLFFNNEDRGKITGSELQDNRLDDNTVALDSYFAIAGASNARLGVQKDEDPDGSIVGGANNDGGSAGIAGGLLVNDDPEAGIPLTTADGLIPGVVPNITLIADDSNIWNIFNDINAGPVFSTTNGAWAVLGGFAGQGPENKILVAQITTDGALSFSLNIRVNLIEGGNIEDYVSGTATGDQIFFPSLIFPEPEIDGCTDPSGCNYNPNATVDDGSCLLPVDDCLACNEDNDELLPIDEDGDGVCNAQEVFGCTDPEALNFNVLATEDDGNCEYEGIAGCTSPTACNYNPDATVDNFSCFEPVENCLACNDDNDALLLVDSDGDGICNADEVAGCQSATACNYNPEATDGDGSCIEPVENCQACNENNDDLVIIDTDGDGICDAVEIPGCTNPDAFNYNPEATDDDGSCNFLSVDNLNAQSNMIKVYPNPFSHQVSIELMSDKASLEKRSYRLCTVVGNCIAEGHFAEKANDKGTFTIEMNALPQGSYLLIIEHPELGTLTKRLLKQ
jgi:hypothetical protein